MKTVTAFQTSDGEIFPDQDSAEYHEFFLKNKQMVDEFIDSDANPYQGIAHKNMARNTVMRWELWRAKNVK
jgi:hypothetical protein